MGNGNETLFSWLIFQGKSGVKKLPSMAKVLAIQLAVILFFQLFFWWYVTSSYIPRNIRMPIIFLTATYNDVIPKTIYWVIVFTFGKRLLFRIKKIGFSKALSPIGKTIPRVKNSITALGDSAYSLLLLGGGLGLIVANNFASYSRFGGARNKFDKYFIAIVISFTLSYLLGEGRKHWIFKFNRLAASDVSRLLKKTNHYRDDHTFVLYSGFVLGLLLDAPLILMKLMYGGYYLGITCIIGAIVYAFYLKGKKEVVQ